MLLSAGLADDGRGALVGLQTLIAPDAVVARPARGYVATRTLKASPRAVGCPGDGGGALFARRGRWRGRAPRTGGSWSRWSPPRRVGASWRGRPRAAWSWTSSSVMTTRPRRRLAGGPASR
ncbi:hypothetical protein E2562_027974 [Oryza meyeriana var. granulata]|uniref:Uncharacterized protein n=1 Tax=Oryza meyeriana var. granulata TaxID=110450 RepID=A0A6G1CTV9_9ORYZ|nr:hypothetical protein E2562_027974 [Oryza meyeriana var. granulata]